MRSKLFWSSTKKIVDVHFELELLESSQLMLNGCIPRVRATQSVVKDIIDVLYDRNIQNNHSTSSIRMLAINSISSDLFWFSTNVKIVDIHFELELLSRNDFTDILCDQNVRQEICILLFKINPENEFQQNQSILKLLEPHLSRYFGT